MRLSNEMWAMAHQLEEMLGGHAIGTGAVIAFVALSEFSDDGWNMMSASEKELWLRDVIARYYTAE